MKIVEQGYKHIRHEGLTPYQFIEKIGRTCYKSEDRITESSAEVFVKNLLDRNHYAMLEHEWVHIYLRGNAQRQFNMFMNYYFGEIGYDKHNPYRFIEITELTAGDLFISAPIRVFIEMFDYTSLYYGDNKSPDMFKILFSLLNKQYPLFFTGHFNFGIEAYSLEAVTYDFQVLSYKMFISALTHVLKESGLPYQRIQKEIMRHTPHTVLFTCNRGVSHELVRHRVAAFAQESTRYCNYSKGKFGNEITVIEPQPVLYNDGNCDLDYQRMLWLQACEFAEKQYFELLKAGATPQEARGVLPHDIKVNIVVTANEVEWEHIILLRAIGTTGAPHPQMRSLMIPWYKELKEITEGRIS